jgi:hypothetical protein
VNVAAAVAQHKGWVYHYIPAGLSAYFVFGVVLAHAWGPAPDQEGSAMRAAFRLGAAAFVAWLAIGEVVKAPWLNRAEEHLDEQELWQVANAAKALAEHTQPDDRVFYFGDNPNVVYLAQRRPAIPNEVSWLIELQKERTVGATPRDLARIDALAAELHTAACERLVANPPAAMVGRYFQTAPDFCPAWPQLVKEHYHDMLVGYIHILLRNDRN